MALDARGVGNDAPQERFLVRCVDRLAVHLRYKTYGLISLYSFIS